MPLTNPSTGGVTDHGALTGLADDDHSQYHNDSRGDARYWLLSTDLATQAELNTHEADTTSVHGIANTASLALATSLPITCRATADHAISSTTETNVTGMSMALAANTNYVLQYYLRCSANAATVGIQFYLTFGGTVTRFDGNLDYYITVSAKGSVDVVNDTTSPFTFEPTVSHGNVVLMNCLYGILEVGASGGTLQLQHGSETATLTTVLRGSWGMAVPVA